MKPADSYTRHMEKVPGEELIHLSVIKICRRKRGCGRL
jgi:hypothetical protein